MPTRPLPRRGAAFLVACCAVVLPVTLSAAMPGAGAAPAGSFPSKAAATAYAEPVWGTPELIVPATGRPEEVHIVADASGNATVTWYPDDGVGLFAISQDPGTGAWDDPIVVDPVAGSSLDTDPSPTLMVGPSGEVTIGYWQINDGRVPDLWSATRGYAGTWASPVRVNAPDTRTYDFDMTIDDAGLITAAWVQRRVGAGEPRRVVVARRPEGGTWSRPRFLTGTNTRVRSVDLDAAPTGEVTVAWTGRFMPASPPRPASLRVRTLTPGAGWSRTERVSAASAEAYDFDVVSTPGGRASVVWDQATRHPTHSPLMLASRTAAGRWTRPAVMTTRRNVDYFQLDAGAGLRTLTWTEPAGTLLPWPKHRRYIGIRVRGRGGWGPETRLSPVDRTSAWPGAHITSDRRIMTHWQERPSYNFEDWEPRLRTRAADGTWSDAITFTPLGASTRSFRGTFLDANDLMHLAWKGSDGAIWAVAQQPS